jgi:hypothetical protein
VDDSRYWEMRNLVHQFMVRSIEFETGIRSAQPNWEALAEHHEELCRIEALLRERGDDE